VGRNGCRIGEQTVDGHHRGNGWKDREQRVKTHPCGYDNDTVRFDIPVDAYKNDLRHDIADGLAGCRPAVWFIGSSQNLSFAAEPKTVGFAWRQSGAAGGHDFARAEV
jgi:hypothetical protein